MIPRKNLIVIALTVGVSFNASAENITFADGNVKDVCVQQWDTNGDGELSTDEAAAVIDIGTAFRENKNVTSFDELVYFTGLVEIPDYAFDESSIERLTLPPTVTKIGECAFRGTNLSGELRVPGTVKEIGNYAYVNCQKLTSVVLEEGVETVGYCAFSGPIATLSLPSTLTYMGTMVIDPYVNSGGSSGMFLPEGDLWVFVHSNIPAAIHSYAFYYVFADAHLVVPLGAIDAYKSAKGWKSFGEYFECGDVNLDGIVNDSDLSAIVEFISSGESEFNPLLSDVNFDGVTDGKDVEYLKNYIESTTSVSSINLTPADTHVYTIDGRRLPDNITISSLPHGIYISNGRKFIVK